MNVMTTDLFRILGKLHVDRFVMPILSMLYTALYISAPLFPPDWAERIPLLMWKTVIALFGLLCSCLLYWSRRAPLCVTTIEALAYIGLSAVTSDGSFLIPLVGALYFCVSLSPASKAVAGICETVIAVSVVTFAMHDGSALFLEWAARMAAVSAVIAAAIAVRVYRIWRDAERRADRERVRAEMLAKQRNQAISRAQVAAELHDSVGHDLTTIIALAQGFAEATDIGELHAALKDIGQVAREGLADTRHAVHTLVQRHEEFSREDGAMEAAQASGSRSGFGSTPHSLDETDTVVAHARAAGLAVVLTETGRRRHDPKQDNLCFIICREAITNTLRHASEPTTIILSRDYGDDGTLHISIHDDGHMSEHPGADRKTPVKDHPGIGLKQIGEQCLLAHGSLSYGPDENGGWTVKATLPSTGKKKEEDPHD
ncbi:two-component system sensor histidine kinase [Bifidobacterium lemurum]|uniref:histidine kinase n=1 Tax=Bifidobacterium lemurum TaxID=1603886 RepID=A0A261FMA5_9BIFI|nr:histidine kinase [Bifidobacterium lemurum]OZG59946.1 two-component system sensor histidine kinase [Bifidobacterium lemurum]QOL33964.1 hypothetical protein BL8807_09430 [Bifidobacterium lemurum]